MPPVVQTAEKYNSLEIRVEIVFFSIRSSKIYYSYQNLKVVSSSDSCYVQI